MDVIVHVAPGAELVALSKSSDWLFHILFPHVSLFRSVSHVSLTCLVCFTKFYPLRYGIRMCFSAGLAVPWGSTTRVCKSPLSQIASLTQTYGCMGVWCLDL